MKKQLLIQIIILLPFFMNKVHIYGQCIGDGVTIDYIKHIQAGATPSYTICVDPAVTFTATPAWFFCAYNTATAASCTPSHVPPSSLGNPISMGAGSGVDLVFSPGGTLTVALQGATPVAGQYRLTVQLNDGETGPLVAEKTYRIIIRNPLEMVFVLDRSGSMECDSDENSVTDWPACSTSDVDGNASPDGRKWDALADAMNNFVQKIDGTDHILSADRFSYIYFDGNALENSDFPGPPNAYDGLDALIIYSKLEADGYDNLNDPPVGSNPLGRTGTSIGAGLDEAFNDRFSGTANRDLKILLITDGEQNAPPLITVGGGGSWSINSANGTLNHSSFANIDIHTVGFGVINGTQNLLNEISSNSGTFHDVADIIAMSDVTFNAIFHEFSPNTIKFDRQSIKATNEMTIKANSGVSRLMFEAHFQSPEAGRYAYKVTRNGDDVTDLNTKKIEGQYFTTFIYDFQQLKDLNSEGEWVMTCSRTNVVNNAVDSAAVVDLIDTPPRVLAEKFYVNLPKPIKLIATADDHEIDFDCSVGKKRPKVGDVVKPSVKLQYNGTPVTDAEVYVYIKKPGNEPLGHILSKREPEFKFDPNEPEKGGVASQKYAYLQSNKPKKLKGFLNERNSTFKLDHKGNGVYTANYDGLDVEGVYEFTYKAIADSVKGTGYVERAKEQTVNVRFGNIDGFYSNRKIKTEDGETTLSFKPAYRYNGRVYNVGPGYTYAIGVEGDDVEIGSVREEADGTYEVDLNTSGQSNPNIDVTVFGDRIYDGGLEDFDKEDYKGHRWSFSIHGGSTFPLQDIETLYEQGYFGEIDLNVRVTRLFSIELVGGYYNLVGANSEPDLNILGGTTYGKIHLSNIINNFDFFAGGGVGYYKPENLDATLGYSLRSGLSVQIRPNVTLSLEAGYFQLVDPEPEISFGTLGAGMKYRF